MTLIQALILGTIQGATEFLPISSSAHLVIVPAVLGWHLPVTGTVPFDVLLHGGTLLAVIAYFRGEIISILAGGVRDARHRKMGRDAKLVALIVLATIPAAIAGLLLRDFFERLFQNPMAAGAFLLVTAFLLLLADFFGRNALELDDVDGPRALVVGVAQAIAIIPGISRSGATISAGMLTGLKREAAARFSFLLAIPIIAGTLLLELRDLADSHLGAAQAIGGFVAAAVVGYACIAFLLQYLTTHKLRVFAVYCTLAGAFTIAFFLLKS